jgi:hypothetical protein
MSQFSIVGARFSPGEFQSYIGGVSLASWKPNKIVLHNTSVPSISQRPNGFTHDQMVNLQHYYSGLGWSGGPHLFIDQNGIWVFNPLDRHGTHSPSWNSTSWGVEMLGEYQTESFDSGPGLAIQKNAEAALATMFMKLGVIQITNDVFKLHKEDPGTTHKTCPGQHVHKDAVLQAIQAIMAGPAPESADIPSKIVVYRFGQGHDPSAVVTGVLRDGSVLGDAAQLSEATGISTAETGLVKVRAFVGTKYSIAWQAATNKVYLVEPA